MSKIELVWDKSQYEVPPKGTTRRYLLNNIVQEPGTMKIIRSNGDGYVVDEIVWTHHRVTNNDVRVVCEQLQEKYGKCSD